MPAKESVEALPAGGGRAKAKDSTDLPLGREPTAVIIVTQTPPVAFLQLGEAWAHKSLSLLSRRLSLLPVQGDPHLVVACTELYRN